MTFTDTETTGGKRKPFAAVHEFLAELKADHPAASAAELCERYVDACRPHVTDTGDDEALWHDRILPLLLAGLNDRFGERPKRTYTKKTPEQRAASHVETATLVQQIATNVEKHVEERAQTMFLETIAPNGRRLADCTGAMCKRFGGFYAEIAKRLSASDHVGKHMTEAEIASIARTYRIEAGEC